MNEEFIQKVRIELAKVIDNNLLVVVEGIKDERSLKNLGVKRIMVLKGPLFSVVEKFSVEKEVVLLTDLDEEGRKLFSVLKRDAQKFGVKVNEDLRRSLFKTDVRHIEGLDSYLTNHS